MLAWFKAFVLTQAVEAPIYGVVLLRMGSTRRPMSRAGAMSVALGASCLTHPVLWFGMPLLEMPHVQALAVSELAAVAVEALYLRVFGLRRALLWAALANGASMTAGLALRAAGVPI